MPGLDRRSSRWCCKARAHALGHFHEDIVPSDVNKFHMKRRASPLLAPSSDARPRHDRAFLHQILKDQNSKSEGAEGLKAHRKSHNAALDEFSHVRPVDGQLVKLPHLSLPAERAVKHKGISNGMLCC